MTLYGGVQKEPLNAASAEDLFWEFPDIANHSELVMTIK